MIELFPISGKQEEKVPILGLDCIKDSFQSIKILVHLSHWLKVSFCVTLMSVQSVNTLF